jgi:circadian clock protein KaiB
MPAKKKPRRPPRKISARKPQARKTGESTGEFEAMLRETSAKQRYELRLYISGTSPRSGLAIANVRSLCDEFLAGRYDLEVIDIYQQPGKAVHEQIIAAPTLIKITPKPARRLIGDLSDRQKVLVGLNLAARSTTTAWMEL